MAKFSAASIENATPSSPHAAVVLVRRYTASAGELAVAISTIGSGPGSATAFMAKGVALWWMPANAAGKVPALTGAQNVVLTRTNASPATAASIKGRHR